MNLAHDHPRRTDRPPSLLSLLPLLPPPSLLARASSWPSPSPRRQLKKFAYANSFNLSLMRTIQYVAVMLTLVTYSNTSSDFTPEVVFTAVSLLVVLSFPLMMLPFAIAGWVQAKVRSRR